MMLLKPSVLAGFTFYITDADGNRVGKVYEVGVDPIRRASVSVSMNCKFFVTSEGQYLVDGLLRQPTNANV